MSFDLIEMALDRISDATGFEKLAAEVLYLEGFFDIKPLGGTHDLGQDAVQDRFSIREGRSRTVFQFTLEDYLIGKLRRTIQRLEEAGVQYSQLVLVTPRSLSAQRQGQLIEIGRIEFDMTVIVYERKTLANRLADLSNGVFHRHFPDIERQVEIMRSSALRPATLEDSLEEGLLKASLAFVFGDRSEGARKALFDELVLAVLADGEPRDHSVAEVHAMLGQTLPGTSVEKDQVKASLDRSVRQGLARFPSECMVCLTPTGRIRVLAALSRAEASVGVLVSDIVGKVSQVIKEALSEEDERRLARNAHVLLAHFFRLFGVELTGQLLEGRTTGPVFLQARPELLEIAARQVSPTLGELLIAATAEVIQYPTAEQAHALANWARAFVGSAILNVDPMLRTLHKQGLAERIFILDTDVVLDAIVRENPRSEPLRTVIRAMLHLGARVVVPTVVLEECARHAERSFRTLKYFGVTLFGMDLEMIERKVHNALVAGFAFARLEGLIGRDRPFKKYLENYYESADPLAFMTQVARLALPDGTEMLRVEELLGRSVDAAVVARLKPLMVAYAGESSKAQYRSADETDSLAQTDAILGATTLLMCESARRSSAKGPFAGHCYLVTNSARYLKACRELGTEEASSVRPQQLMAVVELVAGEPVGDLEFVRLFENPFLVAAVDQIWESAKVLLDDGLSLVGKNLARLRWDFGFVLHDRITSIQEMGRAPADGEMVDRMDDEGAELLLEGVRLGYSLNPTFEVVQRAIGEKDTELDDVKRELAELSEKHDELKKQIDRFGRRRQRYLRKVAEHKRLGG